MLMRKMLKLDAAAPFSKILTYRLKRDKMNLSEENLRLNVLTSFCM